MTPYRPSPWEFRLVHWGHALFIGCFAVAWFSGDEDTYAIHLFVGWLAIVLTILRLLLSRVSPERSPFNLKRPAWKRVFRYGIWGLLALFALTGLSGLAADHWSRLDHLHEAIANITVWALVAHVALAVVIYAGRPLWTKAQASLRAMIPGAAVGLCLLLPAVSVAAADSAAGQALFFAQHTANPAAPSCTSCHTTNLRQPGQHVKTGRSIEPMAPSVNPRRFTDPGKVAERLERDCNNVIGRACTTAEADNLMAFLRAQ